nr:M50 family metallopeptidase [Bacillus alkalicola]
MALTVHELGHAISFARNGLSVRAVAITFFFFIKRNGRWKIEFNPNNVTFMGGIAVPDLKSVKGEEELIKHQKGYARALIAGPLASLYLWVVGSGIAVLIITISSNVYLQSTMFTFGLSLLFITLFFLGSSFIKSESAIGDFPAYNLAKKNRFFTGMQLYQYAAFSTDYEKTRRSNTYLKRYLINELSQKLKEEDTHIYTLALLETFIMEFLVGKEKEIPKVVLDYVEFIIAGEKRYSKLGQTEMGLAIIFRIIQLLYSIGDEEKAEKMYEELKVTHKQKTAMRNYFYKQIAHMFGIEDNTEFLNEKKNINISPAHGIWKVFEGYYEDEMLFNEKISLKRSS